MYHHRVASKVIVMCNIGFIMHLDNTVNINDAWVSCANSYTTGEFTVCNRHPVPGALLCITQMLCWILYETDENIQIVQYSGIRAYMHILRAIYTAFSQDIPLI
jgi:hypothetical protein